MRLATISLRTVAAPLFSPPPVAALTPTPERHMRYAAAALVLAIALPQAGFAQTSVAELRQELVKVQAGKMILEEFGIYELSLPGREAVKVQVKLRSEAPAAGVISRDNFVAYTTSIAMQTLITGIAEGLNITAGQLLTALKYQELKAPIGAPDVEVNIRMTAEGLQLEVVDTSDNTRERHTMTWAEVLGTSR
ncbi:MAG: hypothetical protein ACREMA_09685 [Longimicrobiales bacterium]